MNTFILADIQDVLHSPHPVFGIPLGLGLLLLILFKIFSSDRNVASDAEIKAREAKARELEQEAKRLQDEVAQSMKGAELKEQLKKLDSVNPKPDSEITEKMSVKGQLLSDLRRAAEMGMLTKREYGIKRQKILDMPERQNHEKESD